MRASVVVAASWLWLFACGTGEISPQRSSSGGGGGRTSTGAGGATTGAGGAREDSGVGETNDASLDSYVGSIDSASTDAARVEAGKESSTEVGPADTGAIDAPVLAGCDAKTAHARADQSLSRMLVAFWNGTGQYIDAAEPANGNVTGYWTFAQAFDAVLDGAERTAKRHYGGLIDTFYAAQDARGWSSYYYDDESWMSLAVLRAFDLTGERAYLDRASSLYTDIEGGWDDTSASPGGIWWHRGHTQKATASNAGPVIIGARLAARTGDATTLAFAVKVYDFWFSKMVDPVTFKVADHMLPDGTVVKGLLTYNEGLMVGAAFALYLATGQTRYLDNANAIAQALIKNETKATTVGPVLADGTNTSCVGDCPQWKGVAYRYLAILFGFDLAHSEYRTVLESSTEAAWTLARNATTGLFANDWRGPAMPTASIEAQSSTAMALSLFAALCGPYPGDPAAPYEAEDAKLDHVALDATEAGFSGWGYVSGWTGNKTSVEFSVPASAAADYLLAFDYAAGGGDATRSLTVNGVLVNARLTFPSTGSWTAWQRTAGTKVSLTAGTNLVRLTFDTSAGSAQDLHLDRMTLSP
jgi:predicted alpha-1,6-mannanase (GH76 family)